MGKKIAEGFTNKASAIFFEFFCDLTFFLCLDML